MATCTLFRGINNTQKIVRSVIHGTKSVGGSRRSFSQEVRIIFVENSGTEHTVVGKEGETWLTVAQNNDIDMEGACGGELACSTCHCILPTEEQYNALGDVEEEEEDMLDLAYDVTSTSRLACQIKLDVSHEGWRILLPSETTAMN